MNNTIYIGTHYAVNICPAISKGARWIYAEIHEFKGLEPSQEDNFICARLFRRKETIEFYLEKLTRGINRHELKVIENNSVLVRSATVLIDEEFELAAK